MFCLLGQFYVLSSHFVTYFEKGELLFIYHGVFIMEKRLLMKLFLVLIIVNKINSSFPVFKNQRPVFTAIND